MSSNKKVVAYDIPMKNEWECLMSDGSIVDVYDDFDEIEQSIYSEMEMMNEDERYDHIIAEFGE